jgi:hypothetical protein
MTEQDIQRLEAKRKTGHENMSEGAHPTWPEGVVKPKKVEALENGLSWHQRDFFVQEKFTLNKNWRLSTSCFCLESSDCLDLYVESA